MGPINEGDVGDDVGDGGAAVTEGRVACDRTPPIPAVLLDPRPALVSGTLAWAAGLLVCLVTDGADRPAALCAVGVAVGAAGWAVYSLQRRAVRRGSAGAQRGLDFDTADRPD